MLDLNRKLIAFDIGSSKIKWMVYGGNKKKPVVYDWGIVATPREAVRNGRLINKESLKEVLGPIVENCKVKISGAALTLSCPELIVRTFKLPKTNNKELEQIVRYEIEQYLPENFSDYIVDHRVLGEYAEGKGKILKVLVAAVPNGIVDGYLELMDALNLKTEIIDFHGNSVSRFLAASKTQLQDKTYSVLDLGFLTTTITVMEQGKPVFTRLIQNGNEEITASIANSFNISLEEAENHLINKGMLLLDNEEKTDRLEQELSFRIKPVIDYILNNVYHSLEFYHSLEGNILEGFVVVGGGSFIKNLVDYSHDYLNLQAINYSEQWSLNGMEGLDHDKLPLLANVLGLVFHQEKDINLLPEDYKREKKIQRNKKYRIIGLSLMLALTLAALYLPRSYLNSLKNKNISVEQKIIEKQEYEDLIKLEEELVKNIERRSKLIQSFKKDYFNWSEFLVEIGNNVPQGVAIDNLHYGEDLDISGHAESYSLVAQFMVNLQSMERISQVQPLSISGTEQMLRFKIKCLIEGEGNNEAD
ncbi:MAG: pilus assembly protein PilM [Clostridia bacterium]|nr:pilus assembly protein PilM [Clostridia bacterium]